VAINRRISDIKPLLTNLAQSSHYEVQFGGLPDQLKDYLRKRGVTSRFVVGDAGLLCYSAILPTSNLATNTISGNFMGVQEKFAHTRLYDTITLDFYIDKNYKSLKFIESWMEFIASGSFNQQGLDGENSSISQNNQGYFSRMQYPAYYKSNATRIIKFDRDYKQEIEYNFIGLFPSTISSIPVSYVASDTLKMSATFQYDRYIAGKSLSINQYLGNSNNKEPTEPTTTQRTLVPVRGQSGVVFYDSSIDTRTSAEVNRRFFNGSGQPIIN
jgi:hypothetical protein